MARFPWLGRLRQTEEHAPVKGAKPWPIVMVTPDGQFQHIKLDPEAANLLGISSGRSEHGTPYIKDNEWGYATAYAASDWAFRCLNLRAEKTAELLHAAQLRNRSDDTVVDDHPFLDAINVAYEKYHQDYYFQYVMSLDIFGETYTELVTGRIPWLAAAKVPAAVRVLPAIAMEPVIDKGRITHFTYQGEWRNIEFSPKEIAYDFAYDPVSTTRGMSLLSGALGAINLDVYVQRHNIVYFQNGARPALIIAPKMGETFSRDDYQEVVDWLKKNKGVANWFRAMPINRPVDVTMVEYPSLEDQRYLTEDQRLRICSRLGVPERLVNLSAVSAASGRASSEERIDFHENTVIPLAKRICKFVNLAVLPFFDPQKKVKLELDHKMLAAMVEDEVKHDEMVRKRYLNGQITYNEMREQLRMKPAEDKKNFYVLPIGHRMVAEDAIEQIIHAEVMTPVLGQGPSAHPPELTPENQRRDHEYRPPSLLKPPKPVDEGGRPEKALGGEVQPTARLVLSDGPGPEIILPLKTRPENKAADELKNWRRVAMRRGRDKAVDFVSADMPAKVAAALRLNLQVCADDRTELADLFERAGVWLALEQGEQHYEQGKYIQATRLEFEIAFDNMLAEAREGNLTRRRWSTLVRSLLRRWGARAYLDGLRDGGVTPQDDILDPDDRVSMNNLIAEQSEYVTALGERLFSPDGISDGESLRKAEMWFNKSLLPFYDAGRLSADQNGLYEWRLGATEEHCETCATAHGQKHRLKHWFGRGLFPKSDLLLCNGFLCDCQLIKVYGAAAGRIASIPMKEHSHALV